MNEKRFLFSKNGVLYKYRTWSNQNHKNTLLNGEFYLASPRDFNDPYDCQITIDFDELDTPQKKQEFVNHEMVHHFDRLSKKGVNIESAIREADNRILDTKKFREEWSALANHYYQTNYGILSFSKTWKSILMWSHYANNHRGFCIGIKEEALLDIVCAGQFSRGGLVNYPSTYPKISPFLNWFDKIWQQTMTKAKCWDYEEEYRLVKYYPNASNDQDRKIDLNEAITEVVLGALMPIEHKMEIKEIAMQRNIAVYEAVANPLNYEIDRLPF